MAKRMKISKSAIARALVVSSTVGLLAISTLANAGFSGKSVQASASYPTLLNPSAIGGPVTAVVDGTTEFNDGDFGAFFGPSFDFDDATITITHATSAHSTGSFNGYTFFDVFSTIDSIIAVTIQSDTTGFFLNDQSRVFFDANNVYVNFESLSFEGLDGPRIILGVEFANPVPEPETYAMMLAGLGLLGVFARRRKQKAVA